MYFLKICEKKNKTFFFSIETFSKYFFIMTKKKLEKKSDYYIEAKFYARSIAHGFRAIRATPREIRRVECSGQVFCRKCLHLDGFWCSPSGAYHMPKRNPKMKGASFWDLSRTETTCLKNGPKSEVIPTPRRLQSG